MKYGKQKGSMRRRLGALLLGAAMMAGALAVTAGASQGVSAVTAQLSPQLNIVVNGVSQTFYNVQGQEVHPIVYNGTTYLPLRAIGELMGKNVNWDQSTLTVTLSGTRTTAATAGTPDRYATQQNISAQIRPDFTVVVDGARRTFTDVNGTIVYPLLYNGSNYLPVRAIGGLMGCSVDWHQATSTVTLTSGSSGLVTDADSFGPGSGMTTTPSSSGNQSGATATGTISVETAKAKALAHAGLTSSQVTFVTAHLDYENGRLVYEVEFYGSNYREYDYKIDAYTGAVINYSYEYKGPAASTGTLIGTDRARSIALARVPGATAGHVVKLRLDRDDGRYEYEVEIIYNGMEYEFEIDAYSGAIRSYDIEPVRR